MKNNASLADKLVKNILTASMASILFSGLVHAGPPAQSGPNVSRFETPAWFIYGDYEYMVIHGNDARQQCIDSFEAGEPLPPVFSGTWAVQQVTNPNSARIHGLIKAGEDVETWVYPVEIFAGPDGIPYDNITICLNLIYNYGDNPEIANGIAHVIGRDNNSNSTSLSAHGVLQSPDEGVEDILFNGGIHCVVSNDIAEEKCKVRINLH